MIPVLLVPGTWGGHHDWSTEGSAFRAFLQAQGFEPRPFKGWSGDVDGFPSPFENGRHADWVAGGWALTYLLGSWPYEHRNIIAHSHGGQVVPYGAVLGQLAVRSLVTVCTPSRKDMKPTYTLARPRIGHWRHVYASDWDFMQRAGEFLDGAVGWKRSIAEAHVNVKIRGISHSKLLEAPDKFPLWDECGLLATLRGECSTVEVAHG